MSSDWFDEVFIWDSFIIGNTAARGGGIDIGMEDLIVKNTVFAGNSASEQGGAIYMDGQGMVAGSSFTDNSAGMSGGAVFMERDDFLLTSCALGDNDAPNGPQVGFGDLEPPPSPWGIVSNSVVEGGFPGPGNIDADPLFSNPSVPYDLSLQAGSPCIDAADSNAVPATDILGNPRSDEPSTPNTGVGSIDYADIGAYEY